ncbi:MAG: carboxypeptidase-like regulatory domain-containing protein [Bacteroidota bacterium]
MRYILTVVFAFFFTSAIAQQITVSGKVVDKQLKGIPFCLVKAKDYPAGAYCDENGIFSISLNKDSVKALIFSCLGFEKKELRVSELPANPITIDLTNATTTLNTVVIKDKKGKPKTGILGKKGVRHISDCYQKYGEEIAVFLKADTARHGVLKDIYVYITDEGIPESKFRLHVYKKDPVTNLPADELTDTNLIVNATRGNEWVKADLTNKHIPVSEGVFISVEWISGFGNRQISIQSAKHPELSADHYGQVMGLTLNYGVKHMYHRSTFNGTWGFDFVDFLCPMIYGTYKYKN